MNASDIDPKLDLVFEKTTFLAPSQIWQGWTDPETLKKWFCPRPWKVTECRLDLQPGGEFFTVMQGPNGERMENHGCYLDVVLNQNLVWTNALAKGYRPATPNPMGFGFVATLHFSKIENGTMYRAVVAHADEESRVKHQQMGFQEGWGIALKQLEEVFGK